MSTGLGTWPLGEWSVRAVGPAFGRRRLRRQSQPDLTATQSGAGGPPSAARAGEGLSQDLPAPVPALVADPGQVANLARDMAIPLAIRLLRRSQPRCDRLDRGPDLTCGDASREH